MGETYDASVILPLYKKYDGFMYALLHNYKQFRLVKEVILVIDEPIDISNEMFISTL